MMNLRLYKKPSFVVILLIIPACVIAFSLAADGESGFLHVMLAQSDKNDPVSSGIVEELMSESAIIRFSVAESPELAEEAVKTGKADAAWIFPKKLGEKIDDFIESSYFKDEFVKIVERESSIPLRLSHEKLSAKLFRVLAEKYYLSFTRREAQSLDDVNDEAMMHYYNTVSITEELFIVTDVEGNSAESTGASSYLTSPVRGLLSIVVILSGMAAAMFSIQDEQRGTFSWLHESKRVYVDFACIFIAVLNVSAVTVIALCIGGLSVGVFLEVSSAFMYALCSALFCLMLKQIFRTVKLYGAALPLIVIAMIAVCPIFFDIKQLGRLIYIFPPSLYIRAAYDTSFLLYMALFAVVAAVICMLLDRLSRIRAYKAK